MGDWSILPSQISASLREATPSVLTSCHGGRTNGVGTGGELQTGIISRHRPGSDRARPMPPGKYYRISTADTDDMLAAQSYGPDVTMGAWPRRGGPNLQWPDFMVDWEITNGLCSCCRTQSVSLSGLYIPNRHHAAALSTIVSRADWGSHSRQPS